MPLAEAQKLKSDFTACDSKSSLHLVSQNASLSFMFSHAHDAVIQEFDACVLYERDVHTECT